MPTEDVEMARRRNESWIPAGLTERLTIECSPIDVIRFSQVEAALEFEHVTVSTSPM